MPVALSQATVGNLATLVVRYWLNPENGNLPVPADALAPALHDHPAYRPYQLGEDSDDRRAVLEEVHSQLARQLGQQNLWDELERRRRPASPIPLPTGSSARLRTLPSAS